MSVIKVPAVPGSPNTKYLFREKLYVGAETGDNRKLPPPADTFVIVTPVKSENPFGQLPDGIPIINPTSPLTPPLLGKTLGLLYAIISGELTIKTFGEEVGPDALYSDVAAVDALKVKFPAPTILTVDGAVIVATDVLLLIYVMGIPVTRVLT